MLSEVRALLNSGQFDSALARCTTWIRNQPNDPEARAMMFALLCYSEDWVRAERQLKEWIRAEPQSWLKLSGYERLIDQERVRHSVWEGGTQPMIREPLSETDRLQVRVLGLWTARDETSAVDLARSLRGQYPISGRMDGQLFAGIEDYDNRFGGLLEVFLPNGYSLVPLSQIRNISAEPPATFFDSIWRPVQIDYQEGSEAAFLPVRYPGSGRDPDPQIRLGTKTACREPYPDFYTALGVRFFLMDAPGLDFSILNFTSLDLNLDLPTKGSDE